MRRPVAICLALLALHAAPASAQRPARAPLLLTVTPQNGYAYASWSEVPGATYRVEWQPADGSGEWSGRDAGSRLAVAVPRLENGRRYAFRVVAQDEPREDTSEIVAVTPGRRTDCGTWAVDVFCSPEALRTALLDRQLDVTELRCEGKPIGPITANTPNCQLEHLASGTVFVLDRQLGRVFHPSLVNASAAAIRTLARRALWGDDDPFGSDRDEGRLAPSPFASVGAVSSALSARSFSIRLTPDLYSRVTWFRPTHPVPGRYAIYHEGHELPGGGAMKSAPEVIEWLLARGWQVIAMDMLLNGENEIDRRFDLDRHNDLVRQPHAGANAVVLMLEPIKVVIDSLVRHASAEGHAPTILLAGRSGGGLLASLYSALDERIAVAVNIAGFAPTSVQLDSTLFGAVANDYEMTIPQLYDQVPSDVIQTLGGRLGSFHFYSTRDPCCFTFREQHPLIAHLRALTGATKGRVRVYVGQQPQHGMDATALEVLGRFLSDIGLGMPGPSLPAADAATSGAGP